MAQESPADGIVDAVKGIWNGDNAKKSIEEAWKRVNSKPQPKAAEPSYQMNWKPEANDEQKAEIKRGAAEACGQKEDAPETLMAERLDIRKCRAECKTVNSPDLLKPGQYAYLANTRKLLGGRMTARPPMGATFSAGLCLPGLPPYRASMTPTCPDTRSW